MSLAFDPYRADTCDPTIEQPDIDMCDKSWKKCIDEHAKSTADVYQNAKNIEFLESSLSIKYWRACGSGPCDDNGDLIQYINRNVPVFLADLYKSPEEVATLFTSNFLKDADAADHVFNRYRKLNGAPEVLKKCILNEGNCGMKTEYEEGFMDSHLGLRVRAAAVYAQMTKESDYDVAQFLLEAILAGSGGNFPYGVKTMTRECLFNSAVALFKKLGGSGVKELDDRVLAIEGEVLVVNGYRQLWCNIFGEQNPECELATVKASYQLSLSTNLYWEKTHGYR